MTPSHRVRRHATSVALMTGLAVVLLGCSGSDGSNDNVAVGDDAPAFRVMTEQGAVQGVEEPRQISYKGIPYAAAPTGARRFAPPEPAPQRGDVLQADQFGSSCPQGGGTFGQPSENEDCLFLNVYTPKAGGDYPVMVWIHGGAFETGSGGPNYNPVRLVAQDTVVVTINYRLGAFGFLAHPGLSNAADDGGSGDYGILDQQAALAWVQANIDGFGGDPANVTIFGESAGGHSVLTQIASPLAQGLFDRAIVQSGSYRPNQVSLAAAEAQGEAFASAAGCGDGDDAAIVACLRDTPVADLIAAKQGITLQPNTRPTVLPNSIADVIESGDFNRVPVMLGSNADEGQLFVAISELTGQVDYTPANYRGLIAAQLGVAPDDPRVDAVMDRYELSDYPSTAHAVAAIGTDATFACNTPMQAQGLAANVATFLYEFRDRDAPRLLPLSASFEATGYGAAHAFEIAYVINTEAVMRERGASDAQIALSKTMIDYWTQFARSGDPNPSDGTRQFWPAATTANDTPVLTLDAPSPRPSGGEDFRTRHQCDFWLANGYSDLRI